LITPDNPIVPANQKSEKLHAEVVVNIPLHKVFHYNIPLNLRENLHVGMRVKIPFGNKIVTGFCVGFTRTSFPYPLKDIMGVIDKAPLTNEIMLKLTRWLSSHYYCGWGEAMYAVVPSVIRCRTKQPLTIKNKMPDNTSPLQQHLTFTHEQQNAFNRIHERLRQTTPGVVLLYGITGSGKTEIYLQVINKVLEQGRKIIFLVPEISLTSQTIQRIRARFNHVAILHSNLLGSFYHSQWNDIKEGKVDIVVGVRSSIFCPLKNIGLIIIDEEHENTYKQENSPRYHTRDVAMKRAVYENALVILGSATPSLESYYQTITGAYEKLVISKRIGERQLPSIEIVDMREEVRKRKRYRIISQRLEYYMNQALAKNEQIILFLNRRGFAPYIHCKRCGFVLKCRRCDIPMTFHKKLNITLCHYCHTEVPPPEACPDCLVNQINYRGFGTEKIEDEIAARFPHHKIARMDSDSMRMRDAHEKVLNAFEQGEIQILLGTQMIAKGLDYPNVTLVGVISADILLNFPDFRASERTFQLISQVAGRAGRGPKGGRVVVQSFNPEHYSIVYAAAHDYDGFAKKELEYRKQLGYPPFGKLARILFRSSKEDKVKEKASVVANTLKDLAKVHGDNLEILGPSPTPLVKINTMFRWHLFLKSQSYTIIHSALQDVADMLKPSKSVQAIVDIDPYMML
jgi:primosomal protein N' (replication factor Y) (superfamily II helicase)